MSRCKEKQAIDVPGAGRPNPDSRVETARSDPLTIESHRIDLVEMTTEDVQAFASINVPKLCGNISFA